MGTYKVRNEIEKKRNQWNENEIKRNQRKQNEIENGRKNNRGLKEIKPIFTITMLDYFPHMSVFHQERTGFDHHWTRILCVYSAGVCPFDFVASFKFGNHNSNVKSVERRGIEIKKEVCRRDEKVWRPERTNDPTDSWSPIYSIFFWREYKNPIKNEL